jgi:GPH family glycoside/pentoside/hexuronide:cation symporter
MIVLGTIRFFFIKENVDDLDDVKQYKFGLIESVRLIFKNKYAVVMAVASVLDNVAKNIITIAAAYYFTYIIGDLGSMSLVSAFGILAPLVLLLFPLAMRTIGGMNFVRINLIVAAVSYAVLFFTGNNLPAVIACAVVGGIGLNCLAMIGTVFIIQTTDYGEWHTGKRVEGMLFSFNAFASKVGSGIASLLAGAVMLLGGYVAQAPTQTTTALMSIRIMYSLIPCLCCLCVIIVLRFFDLDKRIPEIMKDLAERRHK